MTVQAGFSFNDFAAAGHVAASSEHQGAPMEAVSYTHLDTVLAVATTATVRFTNSNGTEYQQPSKHTW